MSTGKEEWKKTGKNLGGAFEGLAKAIVRTGTAGFEKAGKWAAEDKSDENKENDNSTVFNDGTWRETGKDLGNAFRGLGSSILGSVERGADKAEQWAEGAKDKAEDAVHKTADAADDIAGDMKQGASQFAEGMKESDRAGEVVADAEIVSEEIIK